jgi:protease IV
MKRKFPTRLWISREVRLAIIVAVLVLLGAFALTHHETKPGIALIFVAAASVTAFWYAIVRPARIPREAVITIRLSGSIHEDPQITPLDQLLRRGRAAMSLRNLRYALEAAEADSSVRGIIVEIGAFEAGLATCHEIHRLLRAAHLRGKRIVALFTGDGLGPRELLIAAGATEVVANPDAMIAMLGVASGGIFLKSALEKLGVQAQTLQWKEYKGAAEMFSRDTMSAALRESLDAIIRDSERLIAEAISESRKIDLERVHELLAAGFISAKDAEEARLIDRTGYREDIRASFEADPESKVFISLGRYLRHAMHVRERGRRPRIAVVSATGPVVAGDAPVAGEYISASATAAQFDRASRDERVSAIVFRINSPGGSAVASDIVWRSVREAQGRGKPVIVSMGDVAGSGGYYIAAGADAIVAEPATITGSIGVVFTRFSLARLLNQVGVHFDFVKTSERADALSISRALTEDEMAQIDRTVGHLYDNFVTRVAEGRKLSFEQAEAVARGRVWTGLAAKKNGLVDEVGGFGRAIEIARERAKIERRQDHELVDYRPARGFWGLRLAMSSERMPFGGELVARAVGVPVKWAPAMLEVLARGGAILLCPFLGFWSD